MLHVLCDLFFVGLTVTVCFERKHYTNQMSNLESRLFDVELQVKQLKAAKLEDTARQFLCHSCRGHFYRGEMKKRADELTCEYCIRDQVEEGGPIATALRMMEEIRNNTKQEEEAKSANAQTVQTDQ